jgi:hypothetical protein
LLRRSLLVAGLVLAATAPVAVAADPIMPLAEVRSGMRCTGLSVVRGTEISSFDVEVLDVIAREAGLSGPRILVRASGPAVDEGGVGQGFSGSPIICGGRNAGAISEGLGDYGNHVVLATPIEEILTDRPAHPARARNDPRLARAARPLAGPLTVSGLSSRTRLLLARAAERAGRTVLAAPTGPAGGYAPVDLSPGASVGASFSTGDIAIGGIGTVAYRDGDNVWAFGHPLDGLGRRALFLQDSYVFGVISNPLGLMDVGAVTYKLASGSGHVLGSMTSDTLASVGGVLGAEPPSIPLRVFGRHADGRSVALESRLADERALGLGAGLSLVAPLAAGQALERLMRSFGPVTLSMCTRFRVRELPRPLGFCNPYFDANSALRDLTEAGGQIDFFDLSPLHVESAEVSMRARPGVTEDVLVAADAPRRVSPGQRIRIRLELQRRHGDRRRLSVPLRVPASLGPGVRTLVLAGSGDSSSEAEIVVELVGALFAISGEAGARREASSVRELAQNIRGLHRQLGIEARFRRLASRLVVRSDQVSYGGKVRLRLRVVRGGG